jgi:hypothetical protein
MPTEARKHQFMRIGQKGWDELRHERHCRDLSSRFYRSPRFSQVATHPHMQGNLPQLRVLPCMLVRADTTRKVRFLMGTVCVSQPALRLCTTACGKACGWCSLGLTATLGAAPIGQPCIDEIRSSSSTLDTSMARARQISPLCVHSFQSSNWVGQIRYIDPCVSSSIPPP